MLWKDYFCDDRRVIYLIRRNRFRKVTFILCVNSGAEPPFSGKTLRMKILILLAVSRFLGIIADTGDFCVEEMRT